MLTYSHALSLSLIILFGNAEFTKVLRIGIQINKGKGMDRICYIFFYVLEKTMFEWEEEKGATALDRVVLIYL